ncbi:hypothetical protein Bpla01_29750 [Burkholderia plantarii]|uniref:DNA polymerase III, alpha subunit n=1 Tax=Burkholderia plantarii TaxID=41899 RepID=A0A0B6RYX4_BURPL|nr:DNA polymerase III, alpha subunit [Burkholderia plantarii]GLZ19445.1 hypothetical protein Bpla01_29750 [Burkholderia plantarii]
MCYWLIRERVSARDERDEPRWFLHGASRAEELVERAARRGYSAIAITDECSLAGVVRAHVEAKAVGLPLIIGSHFQLTSADGSPALSSRRSR